MLTVLKMFAIILSLGIDTLIVSISLGFAEAKGKIKIGLTFACAEIVMPLIGLFIGKGLGILVGEWASVVGGVLLIAVALWFLFFEEKGDEKLEKDLSGWTLILTALSISLDEFAVGFSIGFIGIPVVLTIILVGLQSFVFTVVGITFGAKLKSIVGEWSEKIAGIVLGLLGVWVLVESILHLVK